MREIKFRAWDVTCKTMEYEVTRLDFKAGYRQHEPLAFDETGMQIPVFQLMQFTGLTDKNGKEIYEGDIVEQRYDNGKSEQWTVKIFDAPIRVSIASGITKEVIGNIYENPELLNAQDAGNNASH